MEYLFTSERLGFRNWTAADCAPFAEMNADPAVMEFFPKTLTKEESDALVNRLQDVFEENGFTFFAVDILENEEFIGFIGLIPTTIETEWTPCIEIGWRLKKAAWGKGYATEGAHRSLEFGFETQGATEIYSYTPSTNIKSERVMKKIGMQRITTFSYPSIEEGHELEEHVLYRILA